MRRRDAGVGCLIAGVNRFGLAAVVLSEDARRFREEGKYMSENIVVPFFVMATIGWLAWLIFSSIRRYLLAKMQSGVQMRLLEKVDSSQTLLAYAETESGRRFLESLRVEQAEPATPYRRILKRCSIWDCAERFWSWDGGAAFDRCGTGAGVHDLRHARTRSWNRLWFRCCCELSALALVWAAATRIE